MDLFAFDLIMTHMAEPSVKSMKVYATIESAIELPHGFSIEKFFEHLRENHFGGETFVNSNQGGITNVVTKERIPLSMKELDTVLAERTK
jgi:hypothetical protein